MKQLSAIFWKEWHDARWFLGVALLLFIGMPAIGAIENHFTYSPGFDFNASPWVIPLGGFLALLTGVGITCRDLGNRLEDFWRSRAISPLRWILIKYLVGLAVVLIACIAPLLLELWIGNFRTSSYGSWSLSNRIAGGTVVLFTPLWMVLYSIAFLSGCLIRRTAHATMLALAGMLLIYCLPMVLPFMNWLSLNAFDENHAVTFINGKPVWASNFDDLHWLFGRLPIRTFYTGGMLAITVMALVLSLVTIRRDWRIVSGTKMMYWSIGSTLVLLVSTAALQVGTNLPVLQQLDLPPDQHVARIQFDGSHGMILTSADPARQHGELVESPPKLHLLDMKNDRQVMGPQISLPAESLGYARQPAVLHGHVLYSVFSQQLADYTHTAELRVTDVDATPVAKSVCVVPSENSGLGIAVFGNRLYLRSGEKLAIFDLRMSTEPRLLSAGKVEWAERLPEYAHETPTYQFHWCLPLIPGLSDHERLQLYLRLWWRSEGFANDLMTSGSQSLAVYKLEELKDGVAHFTITGSYNPPLLDQVFGNVRSTPIASDGLVYFSQQNNLPGKKTHGVTVFDVHDPSHPKLTAHFAVPSVHPLVVQPLPDGRAIVGGDQLFVVGKPASRE